MIQETGPIGRLSPHKPIKIIGGGISGLLMGYYLKKNKISFQIIEKEKEIGGKIGTHTSSYGHAEKAANAIFSNDDVIELLDELDLKYYKANRKLKKFVWRKNKAKSPPFYFWEIIKILFSLPKRIKTANIEKMSVYDFFSPLLGKSFTDEVLCAGLGGVYAEDARKLHFKSLFKVPVEKGFSYFKFIKTFIKSKKGQKHKATSISFDGGMQTFINALRDDLCEFIKTSSEMNQLTKSDIENTNYILCTDAHEASEILKDFSPQSSELLQNIKYNSVSTVTVFSDQQLSFLQESFGLLFAPDLPFHSLGILSNSEIYPNRVFDQKHHSYTFIVKGTHDIESRIHEDLRVMKEDQTAQGIIEFNLTPWKRGIPVYDYARYDSIQRLRISFNDLPSGLVIFGNYVDGISIREILSHAKNFASAQLNNS